MTEPHASMNTGSLQVEPARSSVQASKKEYGPAFLDDATHHALHWADVWAAFQPTTPYGQHRKQTLRPFVPGDEEACAESLAQLAADANTVTAAVVEVFSRITAGIPDILDALQTLANTAHSAGFKQLLAMKQFAFTGRELSRHEALQSLTWTTAARWDALLAPFGAVDAPTFSVEQIADEDYRQAVASYQTALQSLSTERRARDQAWYERVGQRPHRDGQLTLPLPDCREATSRLKSADGVQWLRDTPYESVFVVLETPSMNAIAQQVEQLKSALERSSERLLQGLCDHLRIQITHWHTAVENIAALDVRLAKVTLLRRWGGTVPRLADHARLHDGTHPLVTARLQSRGLAFVPVSLAPGFGANVLCGSNMGGKSVAMSVLLVCQALLQYGLPVPAKGFASPLFNMVRFCANAQTDIEQGLSSFGREVAGIAQTWRELKQVDAAMVCFDEPGRSTNPVEGEAMVIGLLRALRDCAGSNNVVFVTTHFAAPVWEPGVVKFQVRGLCGTLPDLLAAPVEDPPWADAGGGETEPGTRVEGEPSAVDEEAGGPAFTGDRLQALAAAMDYGIERIDDGVVPQEALKIGRWLGLPSEIAEASEEYVRRGRRE